jgi:anti-sigma regulatory factor (Ser/Thr protein kinase)
VSRSLSLEPVLTSAGHARRLLRTVLTEAGQLQWLAAAELACTELVTNAVLHAHTTIGVTVTVTADELRVRCTTRVRRCRCRVTTVRRRRRDAACG